MPLLRQVISAPAIAKWLNSGVVTTLAGSGNRASADGTGTDASFSVPSGIAALPNGNLVVCDRDTNRIRLITPLGVVTTLAGSGTGFADGTGTSAMFNTLLGIAVLSNGNLVVTDWNNHRIRLITQAGVVTTLAGSGNAAFADGTGTGASFNSPRTLAALSNGNIVVADSGNNRIRIVTPLGVVTTLAGSGSIGFADGTGTAATFNASTGITELPNGNIAVADTDNQRIRVVTPLGVVTTLAGNGSGTFADGTGTAASFCAPQGLSITPTGMIVLADTNNHRIRLVNPVTGVVTTLAGNVNGIFADGTGTAASFKYPCGVAVLPNGKIAVADTANDRIRLIT